ncbi:hypothetical protein PHMEG_0001171, partial [Phytophthora megakarya]
PVVPSVCSPKRSHFAAFLCIAASGDLSCSRPAPSSDNNRNRLALGRPWHLASCLVGFINTLALARVLPSWSLSQRNPWMLLFASPCMKKSDDIDVNTAYLQAEARDNRHRLATIMNADDSVSKSSLAFILGGNADDETQSANFADLSVGASVAATENRAANVPVPAAAPKSSVKKSRICKFENCTRYVVNRGLCIGHGGGKRCAVVGCTSSAKNLGVCWKHGGSTKCTVAGCENRAKSRGVCWSHGGGRKCSEENCTKTAVSHGLCWAHGGGKRCVVEGCRKPAYERNGNVCSLHQATNTGSSEKPVKR